MMDTGTKSYLYELTLDTAREGEWKATWESGCKASIDDFADKISVYLDAMDTSDRGHERETPIMVHMSYAINVAKTYTAICCEVKLRCFEPVIDRSVKAHEWFSNLKCKYYPCHGGCEDLQEWHCPEDVNINRRPSRINCMFCYCPLYSDKDCGGNHQLTERGIKDCSDCLIPHSLVGRNYIISRLKTSQTGERGEE